MVKKWSRQTPKPTSLTFFNQFSNVTLSWSSILATCGYYPQDFTKHSPITSLRLTLTPFDTATPNF